MNAKMQTSYLMRLWRLQLSFKRMICDENIHRFIQQNQSISQSSVFQGTLYEYTVMRELQTKLFMRKLERVGGANDRGVDIKGSWPVKEIFDTMKPVLKLDQTDLPQRCNINGTIFKPYRAKSVLESLKVLVQCKGHTHTKVGPREFRELVGTFTSMVRPSQKSKTVILMCSPHVLSKNGLKFIETVALPIIYLRIEMLSYKEGVYDIRNTGKLLNYYENHFARKFLQGCGVSEWLKLAMYKTDRLDTLHLQPSAS